MVLKQKFTNGSEQNTDIGNSYLLVERDRNSAGFENICKHYYPNGGVNPPENVAFIEYQNDIGLKFIPLFSSNYNAIMSNNGNIYHVITCMPD